LQTHAVEQNPISLDNLVRAGKTVRGVARRRGQRRSSCSPGSGCQWTALSAPAIFVPARLGSATGDSVFGLDLDWPARVA
jgi:hypothetical protein